MTNSAKISGLFMLSLALMFMLAPATADASSTIIKDNGQVGELYPASNIDIDNLVVPEEMIVEQTFNLTNDHLTRQSLKNLLRSQRKVIITFDDGPHPRTTPQILEILRRRNIKAVFFVLGIQAQKYPHLVKMIADEGHLVGNHSFSHKDLTRISQNQLDQELEKASQLIKNITGQEPEYFRPPYGAINRKVLQKVQQMNMKVLLWTVDPKDWQHKNAAVILRSLDRQLGLSSAKQIGGAILLHDIYPSTVQALEPLLDQLATHEYTIARADLINQNSNAFWAAADPFIMPEKTVKKDFNPDTTGHQVLINIMQPSNSDRSSVALIRAQRTNTLLQYYISTL